MNHSGQALMLTGDTEAARARLHAARADYTALGDPWGVAVAYFFEGELEESLGHDLAAAEAFNIGSSLMREMSDKFGLAWTTLRHGFLRLRRGEMDAARDLLAESLSSARDLGQTTFVLWALAGCAAVAAHQRRDQAALRLWARAAPLLDAPPGIGGPSNTAARQSCGPVLAQLRAELSPEVVAAESAIGSNLTFEEAIALGLSVVRE
jgi:hypothetical protein